MGDGVNTNFNYPLPRGTQDSDYCATLLKAVENIRGFDPAYLLLRCLGPIETRRNANPTSSYPILVILLLDRLLQIWENQHSL